MATAQLSEFVKLKEDYRKYVYEDVKQLSYGYGSKAPNKYASISETAAASKMNATLDDLQNNIKNTYSAYKFNQNELDSLTSFSYNLGFDSLHQLTDGGKRSKATIASKMLLYTKSEGKVLDGLVERRFQEANIFNTPPIKSATEETYNKIGVNTSAINIAKTTSSNSADFAAQQRGEADFLQNAQEGRTARSEQPGKSVAPIGSETDDNVDVAGVEFDSKIHMIKDNVTNVVSPNRFTSFSTMSYNISIYLLTPGQYTNMILHGTKDTDKYILLMQSGGKDASQNISTHFQNDFYINDFQLKSLISTKATGSIHNAFEINFTITEPAGITFIDKLNAAVQEMNANLGHVLTNGKDIPLNYTAQMYLAVIRFYGYDEKGKLVSGDELEVPGNSMFGDRKAAGEKFIPFRFTQIAFRLESDKVVYSCNAIPPHDTAKFINSAATTKSAGNITGQTLGDMMSDFQNLLNIKAQKQEKSATNVTQHADSYTIQFDKKFRKEMEGYKLNTGATNYLKSSTMNGVKKGIGNIGDNMTVDGAHTYNLSAGTSITHAIDVIMQTSEFVTSQQAYVKDKNDVKQTAAQKDPEGFKWYKVLVHAAPTDRYDIARGDYAYDIVYTISEYKIDTDAVAIKPYLREAPEIFVHKNYDYWFTGNNTEILNFHQQYDALWYQSVAENGTVNYIDKILEDKHIYGNYAVSTRYVDAINNPGNNANNQNRSGDVAANIASNLYSPTDQTVLEMEVVGDPDYIAQSELFYSPLRDTKDKYTPVMSDGSVNYDYSQIHLRVNFNTIEDYDVKTGLANVLPYKDEPKFSFIYMVTTITSTFTNGSFKQKLDGILKPVSYSVINKESKNLVKIETEKTEIPSKVIVKSDSASTGFDFGVRVDADVALANDENLAQSRLSTPQVFTDSLNAGDDESLIEKFIPDIPILSQTLDKLDPDEILTGFIDNNLKPVLSPFSSIENSVHGLQDIFDSGADAVSSAFTTTKRTVFSSMLSSEDKKESEK